MNLKDIIKTARNRIIIFGTSPLVPYLEDSTNVLANLLKLNPELNLTILYESDSECFLQSLILDTKYSINRKSYANLITHRDRISGPTVKRKSEKKQGIFKKIILDSFNPEEGKKISNRISIYQHNLKMPFCAIIVDDEVWYTIVTNKLPALDDYIKLEMDNKLYMQVLSFIDFCISPDKSGIFLSKPGEELIQLYDREGFPRGIFPRACFYTTQYKRYSIWGFVFNRKGELLLHQRSMDTKDGRGLWDKSTGGHVDLRDYSTLRTAQRELIEELFLPEAEFSKYMEAYIKDIINYGDWNLQKREELSFINAFEGLDSDDWILFRATDESGDPLSIDRESQRRMHNDDGTIVYNPTIFRADVFLFIAPEGYIDDEEQMRKTFELSEKRGAAQAHKLISIYDLRDWIDNERGKKTHLETFTDDLLFIDKGYRGLLEKFVEFIRFSFKEK